jgi:hypothetical protein
MKNYQEWPGALAAVMLILGIFALPYGYYVLLRWVITAISVYVAYSLGEAKDNRLWIFVGLALLFNPIAPIYSTKSFWVIADLVSAGLFLAFSKKQSITKKEKP